MVYCITSDVGNLLSLTITTSTTPTSGVVAQWIQEVSDGIDARNLGSQTISGAIFDMPDWNSMTKGVAYMYPENVPEDEAGMIVVPPYTPMITLSSGYLYYNDNSLDGATDWTLLKEGPGDDTDYVLLKSMDKMTGQYVGYAIYFYGTLPTPGHNKMRGNITYGMNIDSDILREYCVLQVSKKVIMARLFSGQPMNVATFTGGDMSSYVNTQYEAQLRYINERIVEIEKMHFPRQIPMAVIRGV